MQDNQTLPPHVVAEGPEGLTTVLTGFLSRSQHDPAFAKAEHYILYQFNQQQALIKVDTNQQPFHFWYYDLLGRPATKMVKETIARFLWERCGAKEKYMSELSSRDSL